MLNLTDQERDRFALYLEGQAESDDGLAAQMEKVNTPPTNAIAKRYRTEAMAARIIAAKLRATESVTL